MEFTTRVTANGRVTIPKIVRESAPIRSNAVVEIELVEYEGLTRWTGPLIAKGRVTIPDWIRVSRGITDGTTVKLRLQCVENGVIDDE